MRYGKCVQCGNIRKLVNKRCLVCLEGLKPSLIYCISGKKVSRESYNIIMKSGYVIPEEIEDIRLEGDR